MLLFFCSNRIYSSYLCVYRWERQHLSVQNQPKWILRPLKILQRVYKTPTHLQAEFKGSLESRHALGCIWGRGDFERILSQLEELWRTVYVALSALQHQVQPHHVIWYRNKPKMMHANGKTLMPEMATTQLYALNGIASKCRKPY